MLKRNGFTIYGEDRGFAEGRGTEVEAVLAAAGHPIPAGRVARLAGLLTARVLSAHFDQVTIVERDPVVEHPEARKGQPQTRHLHGLLASGLELMRTYFPDLADALRAEGAIVSDMGEGMNWYTYGGRRAVATVGLMDGATLDAFRDFAVLGTPSTVAELPQLTPGEQALFERLVHTNVRLEQERISHGYVLQQLELALQGERTESERFLTDPAPASSPPSPI